ncbi:MAG: site-specific DNA-methyltransferase [Spirochaetaceae bacterium]|nr:MAG: site-specific DNA-methyltransferase [Spirochaetaceae bacterium]
MQTAHSVHFKSSLDMAGVQPASVDLVVTSPPYPMIAMWDEVFSSLSERVRKALQDDDGAAAFEAMHSELDTVWAECGRVLRPGGFLCINIGDATRTIAGDFRLYSNHARITTACLALGFQALPLVLWRKQTNAPNKFMGSGMLPAGAYVTLEHEYILVLRKGGKRSFSPADAERRRRSAFFWEERNRWFSDLWDFKGVRQPLSNPKRAVENQPELWDAGPETPAAPETPVKTGTELRKRSGAFPFELASRLICMYSLQGDTVLDPFLGTGTTTAAAVLHARNSVGYELSAELESVIRETVGVAASQSGDMVRERLSAHERFVEEIEAKRGKPLGYTNAYHKVRVMTRQETELSLPEVKGLHQVAADDAALRFVAAHVEVEPGSEAPA